MGIRKYHKVLAGSFLGILAVAVGFRILKSRIYYSNIGTNIIVVGDNGIGLVGVRKNEERLVWVDLPDSLKINVGDGDVFYKIGSLWGLGEIDNNGEKLILENVSGGLGLWFQAVVKVRGGVSVDSFLTSLVSFKRIRGLNILDRYFLFSDASRLISKGMVLNVDLPAQVFDEEVDVDGKKWLKLNEVVYVWSRDLWPNDEVLNKKMKIRVINSSGIPGRARIKTHQLESVGFRVVEVTSGKTEIGNRCLVETKDNKDTLIKHILEGQFGCKLVKGEGEVNFFVGKD